MNTKVRNRILFMLYSVIIGAVAGLIIWGFLKVMNFSIEFLWHILPNIIEIPFYTIVVCVLGGVIIGIWKKINGDYPEDLNEVIKKVKKDGGYSYNNIGKLSVSAILPLIFGGSIGPEAGLTAIIAGLCTWIGDKFNYLFKEIKELTQIGISATLSTIFNSPMFGFVAPIESEEETILPKTSKIILYFLSICGAFGIFLLLNYLFGGSMGMSSFENLELSIKEWLWIIPLNLVGIIAGIFYFISEKLVIKISNPIKDYILLKCIISGLLLGITGTILPYTMFSGEHQMTEIMDKWQSIGVLVLLLTAFIKIFITNVCINMGFKGGHFFPCIFSGVSLGYALAILTGLNSAFCVIVITTSLIAFIMNKPLATILLLMIIFPTSAIPVMIIAATIGSVARTFD